VGIIKREERIYPSKKFVNGINFFWWDKELIRNKDWAKLSKASKAVFPVIACHCNKKGIAFPGEETISKFCGRTEKTVREGITGLENFPNFKWNYYITKRGQRSKRFNVILPGAKEKGRSFIFYRWMIDSWMWQQLKPVAQALYPVMRTFAYFDRDEYHEIDDIEIEDDEFDEFYKNREFDYCTADTDILAEYAGISLNSLPVALENLEENLFIEKIEGYDAWKVYLKSKNHLLYKQNCLNNKYM
jgi:hypothetical protein